MPDRTDTLVGGNNVNTRIPQPRTRRVLTAAEKAKREKAGETAETIGNALGVTSGLADSVLTGAMEAKGHDFSGEEAQMEGNILKGASEVAKQFGPWGMLAAGVIDTIGLASKATAKKGEKMTVDKDVVASSGFAGEMELLNKAAAKSKNSVTGLGRLFGVDKRNARLVDEAKQKLERIKQILQPSKEASLAAANQSQLTNEKVNQQLNGGADYSNIFQKGGRVKEILKPSKTTVDSVLEKYKDIPWVARILNKDTRNIDGKTHYFEYSDSDVEDEYNIYPLVDDVDGTLKEMSGPEAFKRASDNGHIVKVKGKKLAEDFTSHKKNTSKYWDAFEKEFTKKEKFKSGGRVNVIPNGSLHARLHHLDMEGITTKGIPIISKEEGGEVVQHAEIEKHEIIFHLDFTNQMEDARKRYNEASSTEEKNKIALELGKLTVLEVLKNTDDRDKLIKTVEV